jgi:hypothetical protein
LLDSEKQRRNIFSVFLSFLSSLIFKLQILMTIQRKGEEIMGWTSYEATYFKKNGDIDRKAECDAYFMRDNAGHYKVLKSSMKGTVYYAAVTTLTKYIGKDENGKSMYESIPEDKQEVWAAVFLTRTEEGRYFHYKDQDETAGPCEDHCPKCILDLLSNTDHELALDWRKRCRKNIQKSNKLSKLDRLKNGSVIRFPSILSFTNGINVGDEMTLTKINRKWIYEKYGTRYSLKKTYINPSYEILVEA